MSSIFRTGWQAALAAAGGAGALALVGWAGSRSLRPAERPQSADWQVFPWRGHHIAYAARGRGMPILLVHGIHPGASSHEFHRVYASLAKRNRVFALDLLGFGHSDRPALRYTPALYEELLLDFMTHATGAADHPVHVVASGHSAAFVLRLAAERPRLFERLVLIEPSGLAPARPGFSEAAREHLVRLMHAPIPGIMLYDLVASRTGLRRRLSHAYKNQAAVTPALVSAYRRQSVRRGARFAPACYLAGMLDVTTRHALRRLRTPIMLAWGRHARLMPVGQAPLWMRAYPRAALRLFDSGDLPHEEAAPEFLTALHAWLRTEIRTRRE